MFKKTFSLSSIIVLVATLLAPLAANAYSNSNLIADSVFDNYSSMNTASIDAFLNTFPSSCISTNNGFSAPDPTGYNPSAGYLYGSRVSAGRVINDAAKAYEINPQVLLTKLQNEEGLVRGDGSLGCGVKAITSAVGYGCPDSVTYHNYSYPANLPTPLYYKNGVAVNSVTGTCVDSASKAGFTEQLIHAAWLLKFDRMRSEGNTSWAIIKTNWDNSNDIGMCYSGPMTQGYRKRCGSDTSSTYYNGYTNIGGQSIHMDTGGTAALYHYTPHLQSFGSIFKAWFGEPASNCLSTGNYPSALSGGMVQTHHISATGKTDNLSVTFVNNTGADACAVVLTWDSSYRKWLSKVRTAQPAVNPADYVMFLSNIYGDLRSEMLVVHYNHTTSGKIEIDVYDQGLQKKINHIVTNQPMVAPGGDYEVVPGDVTGDGRDELQLIHYRGTRSKKIEIRTWAPGYTKWATAVVTNRNQVDPAKFDVMSGDINGDGSQELMLMQYSNTGSKRMEFYAWQSGYKSWLSAFATNFPAISNPQDYGVVAADINGDGRDEITLIRYRRTGSGMIQLYVWGPGFKTWLTTVATNHPTI